MLTLQNLSIRRKQMVIIMLTSSVALLLACAAFVTYDAVTFRRQLVEDVAVLADVIGNNCAAAIDFNDPKTAADTLAALRVNNHVVFACVYSLDGQVFAVYQRDRRAALVPPAMSVTGQIFTSDELHLFRPIKQRGELTGMIFVASDLKDLSARLMRYLGIVGGVFLASLLVALALSSRLQRVISDPILHLTQVARLMALDKDYEVRATKNSSDELGQLVDGFNEMLDQIQQRDAALLAAREYLEHRVEERTAELAESLSVLDATLGSTADGILVVNRQEKKIFQNQRMIDLWKIPPHIAADADDAVQVQHVMGTVMEPDQFLENIRHFYAHPDVSGQGETDLRDGTILYWMTAPVMGKDGRNYGRIWTFRDVTQNRKQEADLRESQALYHSLVEQLPCGVFRKDVTGRYVFANSSFCRILELPVAQILGKTAIELVTGLVATQGANRLVDEKLGTQGMSHHELIMETGRQIVVEDEYHSSAGRRSCYHTVKSAVFGAYGQIVGTQGILFDITERKAVDEALRESQALYYSLVDQLPAGIFRKDGAGRYVFVNAWFCRLKDLVADQILGKTPLALAAYELARRGARPLVGASETRLAVQGESHHQLIMRTGQTLEVEEEYPDETGKPQYLRVVKSPVFGPDGKIMGTQGMLFDITERKRAEAELAYERDLLRTLLDNSTDHIYFKDAQSRFIKSSQIQARQFGLTSADELVGKSDFDFFTEEHARLAFEAEQQIIRTGQPMIGKIEKESWQDGRRESWVLTTKMPVRNKAGEIVGTFGISKDITALKQTEGELSYERDLLRALMNTIPDSIYFKDLQSRFVRVSKSKLVRTFAACLKQQRAASELTDLPAHLTSLEQFAKYFFGKTDLDFLPEKIAREMYEEEQAIIRTGVPLIGKLNQFTRLDGKVTWAITTKMLWRDKDGNIIGTFGTTKDITPMKEAESKVEEVHRQLLEVSRQAGMAEVATNVLHNVGNVLNSVNVSAALVAENAKKSKVSYLGKVVALLDEHAADLGDFLTTDSKGRQLPGYLRQLAEQLAREQQGAIKELDLLRKNIEHIKDIVAMQQSYAKISGVTETIHLTDLVEDALRMNAGALARHEVTLIREYSDVPPVTVEKHKVLQILVNLVRNAKYACDDSGRQDKQLTLKVSSTDNGVRIAVIDNGIGIPPENLTRIFNHGFTTRKDGHGFGLHSGALAAKEMGGALTVHSDGPGQGATFTLELPHL